MGGTRQRTGTLWPFESRILACFAALVVLGASVLCFEHVFFTSDSSDHLNGRRPVLRWRLPAPASQLQDTGGAVKAELVAPAPLDAVQQNQGRGRRLAVVVPSHAGDFDTALASLATWPTRCHESTLLNTDLILYYAGGAEDDAAAALPALAKTGGKCFATTRLILASLREEVCAWCFVFRCFLN